MGYPDLRLPLAAIREGLGDVAAELNSSTVARLTIHEESLPNGSTSRGRSWLGRRLEQLEGRLGALEARLDRQPPFSREAIDRELLMRLSAIRGRASLLHAELTDAGAHADTRSRALGITADLTQLIEVVGGVAPRASGRCDG